MRHGLGGPADQLTFRGDRLHMSSSHSSSWRRGVIAVVGVLGLLSGSALVPRPAAAQAGPDPGATTSTSAAGAPPSVDPPTTVAPPAVVEPTTTVSGDTAVTVAPATTTTVAPAPWTVNVPGPPPPPVIAASPADLARADQLERQIVTQANVLDVLAAQFDQAQQQVAATAAQLDQLRARLASASAASDAARGRVTGAGQTLRQVAVDAYVSLGSGEPTGSRALLATYERGAAQTDAETAIGKALSSLQQLHQAELQLRAAETAIATDAQQTSAANTAATAAAAQAQAAAQAATMQQQQLLNTVSQVSGNLVQLVAAAHAAEAQAAFNRFRAAGGLDFAASAGLGAPSTQAATAVQAAVAQVGKPYVWGAQGPNSFDCSGLVLWAWAQVGMATPRVASDQQAWATPVPISQLAPGDLVFFGHPAHHVAMYVGGGLMVDAPHTGAFVSVVPIWWDDLAGFGRVHGP